MLRVDAQNSMISLYGAAAVIWTARSKFDGNGTSGMVAATPSARWAAAEREPSALTDPGRDDGQPRTHGMRPRRLDGPNGIDVETRVVLPPRVEDTSHQEADSAGFAVMARVSSVGTPPAPTLAATVHHEMRVARAAEGQPVQWESPPTAVPDVLHDHDGIGCELVRIEQPALDPVTAIACELDIENVGVTHACRHRLEHGIERVGSGIRELHLPEVEEVSRFGDLGTVSLELGQR